MRNQKKITVEEEDVEIKKIMEGKSGGDFFLRGSCLIGC